MSLRPSSKWLILGLILLDGPSFFHPAVQADPRPALQSVVGPAAADPLPAGAIARMGTTRFREGANYFAAVLSPDGKSLALVGDRNTALLRDVATGKERYKFQVDDDINELTFTPDSTRLVLCRRSSQIQLLETATGKRVRTLEAPVVGWRLISVAISADGKRLVARHDNGKNKANLCAWDLAGGKLLSQFDGLYDSWGDVALSPDGKIVASWGEANLREGTSPTIQLYDAASGQMLRRVQIEPGFGDIHRGAFAPDGKTLVVAGAGIVWLDLATGKEFRRSAARLENSRFLHFAPDGKTLALGNSNTIQWWDTATGNRLNINSAPGECSCGGLVFPSGGRPVAWGLEGNTVRLWEVHENRPLVPAEGHFHAVAGLAFTAGNSQLISVGRDGTVIRWDAATGRELRRAHFRYQDNFLHDGRPDDFESVAHAITPHGERLLTADKSFGSPTVWNLTTGHAIYDMPNLHRGGVIMVFSPDGTLLVQAGGGDARRNVVSSEFRLWNTVSGLELRRIAGPTAELRGLAIAANNTALAAGFGGEDGTGHEIHVWDTASGKEMTTIKGLPPRHPPLAFTPDGKSLVIAHRDGRLRLWSIAGRRELLMFEGVIGQVTAPLVFSPDGRTLAAAGSPREGEQPQIYLWETASGLARRTWAGHEAVITALAFSSDSRLLATGSADSTLLLWDAAGLRTQPKPPPKLSLKELESAWTELAELDGRKSRDAILRLVRAPDDSVPFVQKLLRPAEKQMLDQRRVARLIEALDDSQFAEREKATSALEEMGGLVRPALRKALEGDPAPEARKRLTGLLEKLERYAANPNLLRQLRALEALELIGTPEARRLIETLTRGEPEANLTQEARAAWQRLSGRTTPIP